MNNVIAALYNDEIPSSTDTPTLSLTNIKTEHGKYERPVLTSKGDDGVYRINGKIRIPNEAANVKFMIAVHSHSEKKRT